MNIKDLIKKHGDTNENWLILEFLTERKLVELKADLNFCIDEIYDKFLEKTKLSITVYFWEMGILWIRIICR